MTESDNSGQPLPDPPPGLAPGVRPARIRAGMTQQEVADRLQVPIDTFRRWDRGAARPRSPQRQRQLAVALGVSLETLFPTEADPHVAFAMRSWEDDGASEGDATAASVSEEAPARAAGPAPSTGGGAQGNEVLSTDEAGTDEAARVDGPHGIAGGRPSADVEDDRGPLGVSVPAHEASSEPEAAAAPVDGLPGESAPIPLFSPTAVPGEPAHAAHTGPISSGEVTRSSPAKEASPWQPLESRRPTPKSPDPADILRTVDGPGRNPISRIHPRRVTVPRSRPAVVVTLIVGLVVAVGLGGVFTTGGGGGDDSADKPLEARVVAPPSAQQLHEQRIDAAEQRGDYDLVMSLASASGDRGTYDSARRSAADRVLDRAGDALQDDRLRTADRLLDRAEHRYGDPRPGRRSTLAERIADARRAADAAERRRDLVADRRRRAEASAAQARAAAASPAPSAASTGSRDSAPTTTQTQPQVPSSSSGNSTSPKPQTSSESEPDPDFF